jgi:hypothetical protein
MLKTILFISLLAIVLVSATTELPYPIENTIWVYRDANTEYKLEFHSEGKLKSHNPKDHSPINDTWKTKKEKIIFYYNDHYIKFKGRFTHQDTIKGFGFTAADKWPFTLVRTNEKMKL